MRESERKRKTPAGGGEEEDRSLAILPQKKEAINASTGPPSVPLLINVLFSFESDSRDSQP